MWTAIKGLVAPPPSMGLECKIFGECEARDRLIITRKYIKTTLPRPASGLLPGERCASFFLFLSHLPPGLLLKMVRNGRQLSASAVQGTTRSSVPPRFLQNCGGPMKKRSLCRRDSMLLGRRRSGGCCCDRLSPPGENEQRNSPQPANGGGARGNLCRATQSLLGSLRIPNNCSAAWCCSLRS